jgi:hypothetical protein
MATAAAAGGGGGPWSSKAVGKKEGARRFLRLNLESAASNRSDVLLCIGLRSIFLFIIFFYSNLCLLGRTKKDNGLRIIFSVWQMTNVPRRPHGHTPLPRRPGPSPSTAVRRPIPRPESEPAHCRPAGEIPGADGKARPCVHHHQYRTSRFSSASGLSPPASDRRQSAILRGRTRLPHGATLRATRPCKVWGFIVVRRIFLFLFCVSGL